MSIQPNRVLARIIEQVEKSDWPALESDLRSSPDGREWMRCFNEPSHSRYATPFHFWVHALRDDLAARSRVDDLLGVAGYALCRNQSFAEWRVEVGSDTFLGISAESDATIYEMQASECRRSSVALIGDRLLAHFWEHGCGESWRRRGSR
jgi:hypothetical protein